MITRRNLIRDGATAAALAGTALAAVQCQPTEAPAAELDPFLAFLAAWQEAEQRFNALPYGASDEEDDEAFEATAGPFDQRCYDGDMPAATTAAGAAAALRKIISFGGIQGQPQDEHLLNVALAFLEGRASS